MSSNKLPELNRLRRLTWIMSFIVITAVFLVTSILYQTGYNTYSDSLLEFNRIQSSLINSVSRFDRVNSDNDHEMGWKYATLSQITDSLRRNEHLGGVGEVVIARKEDDQIIFLLRSRQENPRSEQVIPFDSVRGEPIRLALSGKSGIVVGDDYRGQKVLAAYSPLKELEWGIVTKIAVSEIRQPFVEATLVVIAFALLLVFVGALIFKRMFEPLTNELRQSIVERTRALEAEIEVRSKLEHKLEAEIELTHLRRQLVTHANKASNSSEAISNCLNDICKYMKWEIGEAFSCRKEASGHELVAMDLWYLQDKDNFQIYQDAIKDSHTDSFCLIPIANPETLTKPTYSADVTQEQSFILSDLARDLGLKGGLTVPIIVNGEICSLLQFFSKDTIKPTKNLMETLDYVADQLSRVFEREEIEEKFRHLALHDTLTGLASLHLGRDCLEKAIAQASRYNSLAAVLFIDLNEFKGINDSYGHDVGDAVLKEVAVRLEKNLRNVDTVARIGGDEFIVILSDLREKKDVILIAEKILSAFHPPIHHGDLCLDTGISVGIALFPQDASTPDELLKKADNAMYFAKQNGKSGFQFFERIPAEGSAQAVRARRV